MPKNKSYLAVPSIILIAIFAPFVGGTNTRESVLAGGYGGNPGIGKLEYTFTIERDPFQKICYMQNEDVIILDAKNNYEVVQFSCKYPDPLHNNIYWNANLLAINDGYSQANDVLFAATMVKNMYQDWFGIPILFDKNGTSLQLKLTVNAEMEDASLNLASKNITFGDGIANPLTHYPYTGLDIVAHELTHLITAQFSKLDTFHNQANAVDDAFSDMAGELAKLYTYHWQDWQHASDIVRYENYGVRFFADPTMDCGYKGGKFPGDTCSIGHMQNYKENLNEHYASGIFRKAFYIMSIAENWDIRKAFSVMLNANMHYWKSQTTFFQAGCGVLNAAKDFGYRSRAVVYAMQQVGIDLTECKRQTVRLSQLSQRFFNTVKKWNKDIGISNQSHRKLKI